MDGLDLNTLKVLQFVRPKQAQIIEPSYTTLDNP